MTIRLNGSPHKTSAATLTQLLEELSQPLQTVLIERNGEASARDTWPTTLLHDGDQIEILRVAAGG